MDWNRIEGNWKQTKGKVKEKWGQLTDDDLDVIQGRRVSTPAAFSLVPAGGVSRPICADRTDVS